MLKRSKTCSLVLLVRGCATMSREYLPNSQVPDHPLTWILDQTVSRYPTNTAFIYYGTKLTYAQFSSRAYRFAIGLQRLGINPGDRVAIALPNIPQYPIAFYGALRAGAVVVPTNPLYTEREMQHQLADSGARVLVMLDMFYPVVRTYAQILIWNISSLQVPLITCLQYYVGSTPLLRFTPTIYSLL